jgi:hypothetical protein
MGGPGFVGFQLKQTPQYPCEWLVLRLWSATGWLRLDGEPLDKFESRREGLFQRLYPLFAVAGLGQVAGLLWVLTGRALAIPRQLRGWPIWRQWDRASRIFVGATIVGVDITDQTSALRLEKQGRAYALSMAPQNLHFSPVARWNGDESHLDAWVISSTGGLWC